MDLKKTLADAKEKCKKNAPYIVAGIATVAAVILATENNRLKKNETGCQYGADETHVYVDDEAIRRLKEGQVAEFHAIDDLPLFLTMHNFVED